MDLLNETLPDESLGAEDNSLSISLVQSNDISDGMSSWSETVAVKDTESPTEKTVPSVGDVTERLGAVPIETCVPVRTQSPYFIFHT